VSEPHPDIAAALTGTLIEALRALGDSGRPEQANRLAGKAWAALRHDHPALAERANALMHALASTSRTSKEHTMHSTDPQLDVRPEPPARRHQLIFETYEALTPGAGFVLINDHDPKPLYYQFEAEHPGQYTWDYLEQGPAVWRVRIGRVPVTRPAAA